MQKTTKSAEFNRSAPQASCYATKDARISFDQCAGSGREAVLKNNRDRLMREAEKAAHEYAASLEVGDERTKAFEIFENIRLAGAVYGQE